MMKQPKNINELRDGLSEIFADLCNSTIKPATAKEANNAAGKIIGTIKVQLESAALRKEAPDIAYLR
jgi:hypothetical protein